LKKDEQDAFLFLERRIWFLNSIIFGITAFVSFACSPTKRIAKATTGINDAATSSKNRFSNIYDEASTSSPNIPLIKEEAVGGQGEQDYILSMTRQVHEALPSVEDQVPAWMNTLQYGIIVVGIVAVAWILWYTGIGSIIKRLLGFIPKAKRREADLATMVLDKNNPATIREFIAARRASDPEFDKAYERAHRKAVAKD
tara:strand:- start:9450 stop:10046 length:597 start_codon:yes stop_codon:yes gene_type:complete